LRSRAQRGRRSIVCRALVPRLCGRQARARDLRDGTTAEQERQAQRVITTAQRIRLAEQAARDLRARAALAEQAGNSFTARAMLAAADRHEQIARTARTLAEQRHERAIVRALAVAG
jgi:hypothetical protein